MREDVYGYIRVPSVGQNEDRQRVALRATLYRREISTWTSSPARTLAGPSTGGW